DVIAATLFLQGNCSGLAVRRCTLGSGISPTYTALSNFQTDTSAQALRLFTAAQNQLITAFTTVASTASPPTSASSPPRSSSPRYSPPQSSPPPSLATTLFIRALAALDAVVARRLTFAFAGRVPRPAMIATIGLMSTDRTRVGEGVDALVS